MAGVEELPPVEWKEPAWSHCPQAAGMWNNEHMSAMALEGCVSHAADLLACGDEHGILRLFSFPCTSSTVSASLHPRHRD